MAANKFATMLHRNTNKITLILIYAALEWILILLLLLNSLFSYLIIKFAEFFGLNPPCLLCTRLDHIFDSSKGNKNMHIDLLCEVHSKEISKLGYCSNHRKLAQSHEMCEDCLSSRPEFHGSSSSDLGFLNRVKDFETGQKNAGENREVLSVNCSCCGVSLKNNIYSSYILLKTSSWDVLECAQKENLIIDAEDNHVEENNFSANLCEDVKVLEFDGSCLNVNENEEVYFVNEKKENEGGEIEIGTSPQHLEFFLDYSGHKLVPVELVSITEEHKIDNRESILESAVEKEELIVENGSKLTQVDKLFDVDDINEEPKFSLDSEVRVETKEELVVENGSRLTEVDKLFDVDINEGPEFSAFESMEIKEDENSLVLESKDLHLVAEEFEQFTGFTSDVQELVGAVGEKDSDVHIACGGGGGVTLMDDNENENEEDVSIGTEIPDLDVADEIHEDYSCNFRNSYLIPLL
ncbi:hypothetical protein RD792_015247 [Penstemon davidsonii]|uniref:Uncharacterized protein n=1 Tax=Penstemon davidsonii TaxID=160366 RepID=A0ABR0CRJ6_9LAMI|nr:hypothetical protein RD792_015247 [Penstemon davidsonii]